ncbi:MAG: molybdenum cofactor biosynthesis protein MoaE [Methylococcaceae bacterium]|nr:molybdenum cofactor biosynthesis protein MoaE [Methylococcaceae bacterium]
MKIKIVTESFDPWQEIQQFQQSAENMRGKFGATSIFIGTMRDFNEGDDVKGMTLEHYPGMTEKQLDKIISESMQKWSVIDVLVVHRVGDVFPDDPIVLVAVWSSHRGDAFDSSRYIMEVLKSKAPFWKKEILSTDIKRWVDKNTDGYL